MDSKNYIVFGWFALIAAIVIAVTIVSKIQARKRTQALQQIAQQIGFIFLGESWTDPSQAPQLQTALFDKGRRREFRNILIGSYANLSMSIFDYRYTTGGGKSSHTWTQTVATFTQKLVLPLFELRPEGLLDRIGEAFVHRDVDFDSHPEFSRRYLLRGTDPDKIRELFSPALLSYFESLTDARWNVEGAGNTLVVYRSDKKVDPEQISTFRDEASALAQSLFTSCGLRKSLF